jgi:hypothetical protein
VSLTTYSELKTSLANWLHRSDLTSNIPDFISLCEADFNRKLRIRAMETQTTLTCVAGTATVALPTRYKQMKRIYVAGTPKQKLTFVSAEQLYNTYAGSIAGKPKVYTIEGENVVFGPTPDSAYSVPVNYFSSFAALTDVATTNWVLTNCPDIYLYGSLVAAEPYILNDKRLALWKVQYDKAIQDQQTEDDRDRASGTTLTMRSDTGNP